MPRQDDLATIATFYRRLQWAAIGLLAFWVLRLLAPILSPFVFAACWAGWATRWSIGWKRAGSSATPR